MVEGFRYEEINCWQTETGFVEEHRVCGTLAAGSELIISASVICEVDDGKISNLREYVDSGIAAGLTAAVS